MLPIFVLVILFIGVTFWGLDRHFRLKDVEKDLNEYLGNVLVLSLIHI